MYQVEVVPIVVSTILAVILGFFWYSPVLFGEYWMKQMGYTKKSMAASAKKMGPGYGLMIVATITMLSVLSYLGNWLLIDEVGEMMFLAFLVWIGFVLPVMLNGFIFGGRKMGAIAVEAGYQLTILILASGILVLL